RWPLRACGLLLRGAGVFMDRALACPVEARRASLDGSVPTRLCDLRTTALERSPTVFRGRGLSHHPALGELRPERVPSENPGGARGVGCGGTGFDTELAVNALGV